MKASLSMPPALFVVYNNLPEGQANTHEARDLRNNLQSFTAVETSPITTDGCERVHGYHTPVGSVLEQTLLYVSCELVFETKVNRHQAVRRSVRTTSRRSVTVGTRT